MNSFNSLPVSLSMWVCIADTNHMNSFLYEFKLYMNSLPYKFIHSSMTEPTFIPHFSVQGEHNICPVCDRLSVHGAFVWCIYISECKLLTCSLGRQVSIHRQGSKVWKQVRKWYVSRKSKKYWFIFAWISVRILLGFFLVINKKSDWLAM